MSFEFLSPLSLASGLLGLAGALFVLHRLRVRHREVIVPTTLFWKQAVEDSLARKLTARFRHPRAYVFVLAILALLLFALAGPTSTNTDHREYVVLLDGSASAARGDNFTRSLQLTAEVMDELPAPSRRLLFMGAVPRTLLGPNEANLLLEERTANLQPEAAPETITSELLRLARDASLHPKGVTALIVGDTQLSGELAKTLERLSDSKLSVLRVSADSNAAAPEGDSSEDAMVAMGMAPAASGDWSAVDVYLASASGKRPTVAGIDSSLLTGSQADGYWLRDLPVGRMGSALTATAQGESDTLTLDDSASLRAPAERAAIGVWLAPSTPIYFSDAVEADPGLFVADAAAATVAIGPASELVGASAGALWTLSDRGDLAASFEASATAQGASFQSIFTSLHLAGLERISDEQMTTGDQVTFASRTTTETPQLFADAALFAPPFELVESQSFPLLVGMASRWLAGSQTVQPFAIAGHALPALAKRSQDVLVLDAGLSFGAVGAAAVPPIAGNYNTLHASLLSPITSGAAPAAGLLSTTGSVAIATITPSALKASGGADWNAPLLLLALLLLLGEWHLFRSGRMP